VTVTLGDPTEPVNNAGARPPVTPEATVVSVRGETAVEVKPEIVTLLIAVTARAPGRPELTSIISVRNAECLAVVRCYAGAIEKIQTSRLSVTLDHGVCCGSVRNRLTVSEFSVLAEMVGRLAAAGLATVDGPWWQLRPDSPVYRQARAAAAREAVIRATQYAEALGGRLTGLLELADVGLSIESRAPVRARAAGRARRQPVRPGDARPAIDLEPQAQIVHAAVQARFTMSAG
jgi:uncharacterized protein YggE